MQTAQEQTYIHLRQQQPEGWQQAIEQQDIQALPAFKQAQEECRLSKAVVKQLLAKRMALCLVKQSKIAARFNAEFEELHKSELRGPQAAVSSALPCPFAIAPPRRSLPSYPLTLSLHDPLIPTPTLRSQWQVACSCLDPGFRMQA